MKAKWAYLCGTLSPSIILPNKTMHNIPYAGYKLAMWTTTLIKVVNHDLILAPKVHTMQASYTCNKRTPSTVLLFMAHNVVG